MQPRIVRDTSAILTPIAACVLLLLLTPPVLRAHPGHGNAPDLRTWKDAEGLFEIEASFVQARDDKVQVCKHDGTLVWIPLDKLSRDDQDWVRKRLQAVRDLNTPAEPQAPATATPPSVPAAESAEPNYVPGLLVVAAMALPAGLAVVLRRRAGYLKAAALLTALVGSLGLAAARPPEEKKEPAMRKHFEPFKGRIQFHWDERTFFVESDGMPDHPMMIGIKAWQQQVPLPQPYRGRNAWQIPLQPKLADKPISAKTALFRGAIALAVNGVPIFNALNNRGEDAFLAGELDEYGGHCGRGDDYHYHIAPVHLEKVVGKGNPIAYALDGFPIYGYTDAAGKEPRDLDAFNGRMEPDGYRYYSTRTYPYINGGMRGVVTVRGDGIEPQPRDAPVRPAGKPLRGAKITDFTRQDDTCTLKYDLQGRTCVVKYTFDKEAVSFVFIDGTGKETKETYRRRERPEDREPPPPPREDRTPPKADPPARPSAFKVTSPAFADGAMIPVEYTGDGAGVSPPLAWTGAPEGTKYYALQVWHIPGPGEVKSYWVVTNIPATVTSLPRDARGIGKDGINDKGRTGYDPMKSKGPGVKEYHITVYALSAEPKFRADKVTRADLLAAIKDITLAESTLNCTYERTGKPEGTPPPTRPDDPPARREGDRPPRYFLGELFPPNVRSTLRLTREQEKEIADLEKEVGQQLSRILTPEQKKRLEEAPPPPPPPPPPR